MKKSKWYLWEKFAQDYYFQKWFNVLEMNYTIRWWEIDLIVENELYLVFVEVKVVDWVDDLFDYITKAKLKFLSKTIENYLHKNPTNKTYRLDFVFVKNWKIFEVYENIDF